MTSQPYLNLIRYKQWADRGLHEVVSRTFDRLDTEDSGILLRILDHILVVDRIFQHHLQGLPNPFHAPRSEERPDVHRLIETATEVDEWYVSYAANQLAADPDRPVDFIFTNGMPGRMTRGEIILHVCLHGTYHRGNAGIVLQKNGITPNDDRMTDFLEMAA